MPAAAKNAIFFAIASLMRSLRKGLSPSLPRLRFKTVAPPLIACVIPLATSNVDVLALGP